MADPQKQKYYRDNIKERLEYQRRYYRENKDVIRRRFEVKTADDPEWKEKQREYNREYYRKNRARILANRSKRKDEIAKSKAQKAQNERLTENER